MDEKIFENQNIKNKNTDMISLANEITLRSYSINRVNVQKLFGKLSVTDYAAMWILSRDMEDAEENKKIYLADISQKLKLPIEMVSKVVKALQERGLITWNHDGIGEDGTYIQVTEKGIKLAIEQQEILKGFYKNVVDKFGKEHFVEFLKQVAELDSIMYEEINKEEYSHD